MKCDLGLGKLEGAVIEISNAEGLMPRVFGTIMISGGISTGTPGMKYSILVFNVTLLSVGIMVIWFF